MDGNKLFLMLMLPRGVLEIGDANERELAFNVEMRVDPPNIEGFVVFPTLDSDVSARLRYHGLRESKWRETVKEKRDDAHDPTFAVDCIEDGLNLREEDRG